MRKWLLPVLIILVALLARLIPGPRIIDDSYITYRYSRNILAGNGFVFNQSEPVLGTTTPLYTMILTALALPFGGKNADYPAISWLLNAILDAASCLVIYQMGKERKQDIVGASVAFLWSIAPFSVTFSIGGLETSLVVLLLLLTAYSFLHENIRPLFLFSSLLLLTRPDSLILTVPLLTYQLISSYKSKSVSAFFKQLPWLIVPYGLWMVYAWITYGSPIPHSITAKSVAYHLPPTAGLVRLIQHLGTPFIDQMTVPVRFLPIIFFIYLILYIAAILLLRKKDVRLTFILIYPLIYTLVFSLANPLIFRWYLTPPTPFYFLALLTGFISLISLIHNMAMRNIVFGIGLAYFAFASLHAWQLSPDNGPSRPAPEMAFIGLEQDYLTAAEFLIPRLQPQDTLAAGDVGVLGYFTNARILDTVGLNSPESSRYYPLPASDYVINYAIPTNLILDEKPDFLVFPEVYGRNTLLRSTEFDSAYQLIHQIPSNIYGSKAILIFEANDHAR